MKIYMAGQYGRREELAGYAESLELLGHTVTSRWLDPEKQPDMRDVGGDPEIIAALARNDLKDIQKANVFLAFTEAAYATGGTSTRGGRHVEMGYARALGLSVYLIGPRENVFHWMIHDDMIFEDFGQFLTMLSDRQVKRR